MSDHRPMTKAEFEQAVYFAVLLNAKHMPVLKGLDKLPRYQREQAIKIFADRLAEHMLGSNLQPYKGPPALPHTLPLRT